MNSGLPATGLVPVEGTFENYRDPLSQWSIEQKWWIQSARSRDRNRPRCDSASVARRRVGNVSSRPQFLNEVPCSCQTQNHRREVDGVPCSCQT